MECEKEPLGTPTPLGGGGAIGDLYGGEIRLELPDVLLLLLERPLLHVQELRETLGGGT